MTDQTVHLRADPLPGVRPSEFYAVVFERLSMDTLAAIGFNLLRLLLDDLGSAEATWAWVASVAKRRNAPVLVNVPDSPPEDGSTTVFIAPPGWSSERLQGYVAARHEELAEMFGSIAQVRSSHHGSL